MKKGAILLAVVMMVGMMFSSAWAQSIQDIYWTPDSPVAGAPVMFHVKVSNPGPAASICIKLLTPGGTPDKQTHPGIGIRKDPPMDVLFKPVVYAKPGEYKVTAQIMDKGCEKVLSQVPYRTEQIKIGPSAK